MAGLHVRLLPRQAGGLAAPEDAGSPDDGYAAGLRALETVGLKVGDVDSCRMVIRPEAGSGGKICYVRLSAQLLGIPRIYWRLARPRHWLFSGGEETKPIDV